MKKIVSAIACVALGLTMVSCGNKNEEKNTAQDSLNDTECVNYVDTPVQDTSADASVAATDSKSSENSENWDAVLDSYENYVNQYIKLMKKAQAGDVSAVAEYASMMEKAEDLSNKLEKAEDSLSSAQLARYTKITQKLASAAM